MSCCLANRVQLEAQMKTNARQRIVAPMSDTEKLINKQLLVKLGKLPATGGITAAKASR